MWQSMSRKQGETKCAEAEMKRKGDKNERKRKKRGGRRWGRVVWSYDRGSVPKFQLIQEETKEEDKTKEKWR